MSRLQNPIDPLNMFPQELSKLKVCKNLYKIPLSKQANRGFEWETALHETFCGKGNILVTENPMVTKKKETYCIVEKTCKKTNWSKSAEKEMWFLDSNIFDKNLVSMQ